MDLIGVRFCFSFPMGFPLNVCGDRLFFGEAGEEIGGFVGHHFHFFGQFFVAVGAVAEGVFAGLEVEECENAVPLLVGVVCFDVHAS